MDAPKTILLTTDFSETSRKAVAPAVLLARTFGARILLAHVVAPVPAVMPEYAGIDLEALEEHQRTHAREELSRCAAEHLPRGLAVECLTAFGIPHLEIVRLATEQRADLIVMATHGRGFFSHAVLGSTAERVLRRSPCPVLVIRDPGAREG